MRWLNGMYVLYSTQLLAPAEGLGSWEPKDSPCSFSDLWSPAKQSKQFGSRPTLGWLLYYLITVIYGQTQCSCVCHCRAQTRPVVTAPSLIIGKIAIEALQASASTLVSQRWTNFCSMVYKLIWINFGTKSKLRHTVFRISKKNWGL